MCSFHVNFPQPAPARVMKPFPSVFLLLLWHSIVHPMHPHTNHVVGQKNRRNALCTNPWSNPPSLSFGSSLSSSLICALLRCNFSSTFFCTCDGIFSFSVSFTAAAFHGLPSGSNALDKEAMQCIAHKPVVGCSQEMAYQAFSSTLRKCSF